MVTYGTEVPELSKHQWGWYPCSLGPFAQGITACVLHMGVWISSSTVKWGRQSGKKEGKDSQALALSSCNIITVNRNLN